MTSEESLIDLRFKYVKYNTKKRHVRFLPIIFECISQSEFALEIFKLSFNA